MASSTPTARGRAQARPIPGQLQTNDTGTRHQRFSWQETPLDVQQPSFQQYSSPTNSTIDESPISPPDGYHAFSNQPQSHGVSIYPIEKPPVERAASPYNIPAPTETHPAYFAPVVEEPQPSQPELRQPAPTPGTDFKKASADVKPPAMAPAPGAFLQHPNQSAIIIKPNTDGSTLVYDPKSLAGPNAAVGNHRPGQVAHPNASIEPEWKHGLCEIDTLCCIGLCCPCILYGKTQYRISRKTQKEDPTNMLGYESCNGSCGLMAFACGFQCKYRHMQAICESWLTLLVQGCLLRSNEHGFGSYII
ncbi:MAG: hypothetical protein L6R39_001518 [Caloplaca ligustica]|nr:MAG: hypothetical protein L6R39_001518 [Caloplaca ligustica]